VDIDPECQLPFLVGKSSMDLKLAWCAALLTRIIDAAEFFVGGLDDLATMGGGLDIAGQKHSLAPGLL
jgi:hypothetical protein